VPRLVLPAEFSPGDSFISQDVRVTRTIKFHEKARLLLIGEVFNLFNIANLAGYSSSLDRPADPRRNVAPQVGYGQPTSRVSPIFGTGGTRAFQFAARLSF
jgi:hypothetical protein